MKWLLDLLEKMRPLFEERGKFALLKPIFETAENIFFYPSTCTPHAPHVRDPLDIKRFMGVVLVAMMPCIAAAFYSFGIRVLWMILVSYVVGGICEVTFAIVRKGEVHEGFFVTGLIFPLTLPPTTPLWVVGVGILAGTFFGKEVFGGTGKNIFNPALVGRLFVTIAFPTMMSGAVWQLPCTDAITAATPMAQFMTRQEMIPLMDLLLGKTGGSIGETFHLGIIIGGLYLMYTKVADWRIPLSYLGSVFVFALVGNMVTPRIAPPLFQLLGGGLLFGVMFMATDPVTSPFTRSGKYVFGVLCGLLTVLIRAFSIYPEGVMFSIVIMNAFVPMIDHVVLGLKYREATA